MRQEVVTSNPKKQYKWSVAGKYQNYLPYLNQVVDFVMHIREKAKGTHTFQKNRADNGDFYVWQGQVEHFRIFFFFKFKLLWIIDIEIDFKKFAKTGLNLSFSKLQITILNNLDISIYFSPIKLLRSSDLRPGETSHYKNKKNTMKNGRIYKV